MLSADKQDIVHQLQREIIRLQGSRPSACGKVALGLFQQAANFIFGGVFASVAVFAVFIAALLAAPQGLLGAAAARRV